MISRDGDEHKAECDECGHEEFSGVLDFYEFIAWLKDQGWKIRPLGGGEYTHACSDCEG